MFFPAVVANRRVSAFKMPFSILKDFLPMSASSVLAVKVTWPLMELSERVSTGDTTIIVSVAVVKYGLPSAKAFANVL